MTALRIFVEVALLSGTLGFIAGQLWTHRRRIADVLRGRGQ